MEVRAICWPSHSTLTRMVVPVLAEHRLRATVPSLEHVPPSLRVLETGDEFRAGCQRGVRRCPATMLRKVEVVGRAPKRRGA